MASQTCARQPTGVLTSHTGACNSLDYGKTGLLHEIYVIHVACWLLWGNQLANDTIV